MMFRAARIGSQLAGASRWAGAASLASLLLLGLPPSHAFAEDAPTPADNVAPSPADAETATGAEVPADEAFTEAELRKLLAPFALYPDALLAQLLPACAYPVDIVQAARWLDKNEAAVKKGDFSGADAQSWDPSVKALVRFPDVIQKLNTDLDVTTDLGDAFVNQPEDVAAMVQTLRAEAEKGGSLKSTKQQTVTVQQQGSSSYIVIQPTDPEVIYVPTYNPATVYYDDSYGDNFVYGAVGFGLGVAVGVAVDNVWDWNRGWVYPPRWPGYPGYRPGYPGRNGNVNIGNDINIGGNNNVNIGNGNTRPWRPDGDKYRPGQGSKPALANKAAAQKRPGAANAVNRQGAAGAKGNAIAGAKDLKGGVLDKGAALNKGAGLNKGGVQRPAALDKQPAKAKQAANKVAKQPAMKKPAQIKAPAKKAPKPTAFGDVRMGGASPGMGNRGAASRQNVYRPSGGAPSFNRGGGGGAKFHGGGGGRGGGGRGGGRR